MSKVLTIAWREFKQTVFRKVFLLAIVGIPILIVAVMVLMIVVIDTHEQPPLEGAIAVVDPSGETIEAARVEFDAQQIEADKQQQTEQVQELAEELMGGATPPAKIRAIRKVTSPIPTTPNASSLAFPGFRQQEIGIWLPAASRAACSNSACDPNPVSNLNQSASVSSGSMR